MIFDAVKNKYDYNYLYKFLYLSGCRISEALSLKWVDVKDTYIEVLGKGKRIRTIPLEPFEDLRNLLTEMREFRKGEKLFERAGITYTIFLKNILVKLGIDSRGKNTHSFRKTRENELIHDQHFSAKLIAELLGHTEAVQKKHYLQTLQTEELNKNLLREMEINKNFTQ